MHDNDEKCKQTVMNIKNSSMKLFAESQGPQTYFESRGGGWQVTQSGGLKTLFLSSVTSGIIQQKC